VAGGKKLAVERAVTMYQYPAAQSLGLFALCCRARCAIATCNTLACQ